MELLKEAAHEFGLDLGSLVSEEDEALEAHIETQVQEHPLVRQATEYVKLVGEWLGSSDECGNGDYSERS